MASPQNPGDRREDQAAAAGAVIAAIYAQIELVLIANLASLVRKTVTGALLPGVAARKLRQATTAVFDAARPRIEQILGQAAAETAAEVSDVTGTAVPPVTPQAAAAGLEAADLPEAIAAAETNASQAVQDVFTAAVQAAHDVPLPPGAAPLPGSGPPGVYRDTADAYRYAVEGAIRDTRGGLPANSLSLSRIQAAQKALDDLADHGITGFTDKAGHRWDLATYVEMATRTAVSNAWDELQNGAMIRAGLDLVTVYTHSAEGSCPHCLPWLGRTLSLTGATPGYRTLDEAKAAGFRHPQCRCAWFTVGAGIMPEVAGAVPIEQAAAAYEASQKQRALERVVRAAGRRAQSAMTAPERTRARRDLAAARAASEAHRQRTGVRMTKVGVKRRERPFGAR